MSEVLIIDDDKLFCGMLNEHIQRAGHGVSLAHTKSEGLQKAERNNYDVIFLDIRLPDGSGLDILPSLRQLDKGAEVIIISGHGDAKSAEIAITNDAWDFIHKQSTTQSILLSLSRALQYRESKLQCERKVVFHAPDIIGRSSRLKGSLNLAAQAANSEVNTLIVGETGTGKELFAQTIHENSQRSNAPFIVVDCASLPESLVGSILFGHEKGAFTGAESRKDGLIKQADGGILFLDEIGEMPMDLQKSFLRVIQERRFRPIGSGKEIKSNFRLIAATNKNLDQMVEKNLFRADLLFRLRALTITVPPLRDRMDDLPSLTVHFISKECRLHGNEIKGASENFYETLEAYNWPGNVRELENAISGGISKAGPEPTLYAQHLPINIRMPVARASVPSKTSHLNKSPLTPSTHTHLGSIKEMRILFEIEYLKELVKQSQGSIESACLISQLSRPHVYSLLKKHRLHLK